MMRWLSLPLSISSPSTLSSHVSRVVHDDELRPVEAGLAVARVRRPAVVLLVEELEEVLIGEGGRP